MMNHKFATFLAGGIFLSGCATPHRVFHDISPLPPVDENPYAGQTLYLKNFLVRNKGSGDTAAGEHALRLKFVDYLRREAKFGRVVDAVFSDQKIPGGSLTMSVEFSPQLRDERLNMGSYLFGLYTLTMISPRYGTVTVIGTSTLRRDAQTLSVKTWTSSGDYSYLFFGGWRNAPLHQKFRVAYEEVIAHIATPMKGAGDSNISRSELESMVKSSVEKAAKGEASVIDSDVDLPAYALPEDQRNFAVVAGIESYQQIAKADFGERDAQAVRDHLVALGFPPRNIVHLSGSMATLSNLQKYLEHWLPSRVKPDSRVVVFFSGHGAPDVDSKQAYLVPWDGDPKFLQQTGYPLTRLYASLSQLKTRNVLVGLDSCFSGAGGRSVLPQGARPLVSRLADLSSNIGSIVVVSAADADEISLSEPAQGHGLFTYYLLKGLNDKQGAATVKGLYDFLVPRVQDGARVQNRDQTPQLLISDPRAANRIFWQ